MQSSKSIVLNDELAINRNDINKCIHNRCVHIDRKLTCVRVHMYTYYTYIIFVLAYTERQFIGKAYSLCYYSKFRQLFYRQQKENL